MTGHRGYVAQFSTGYADGRAAGVEYQAFCHACGWSGDVTRYEPLARHQANTHTSDHGGKP